MSHPNLNLKLNLIPSDRRVSCFKIVHFYFVRPSSFIPLDRPVTSIWTVYFYLLRPFTFTTTYRMFLWTVHFWISWPSTFVSFTLRLLDLLVAIAWIVQFNPHGPFTLDLILFSTQRTVFLTSMFFVLVLFFFSISKICHVLVLEQLACSFIPGTQRKPQPCHGRKMRFGSRWKYSSRYDW